MERKRYSKEVKAKALDMYLGGKTLTEVGKELSIPNSTLGTWFKEQATIREQASQVTKVKETPYQEPITELEEVLAVERLLAEKDLKISSLESELKALKEALKRIIK